MLSSINFLVVVLSLSSRTVAKTHASCVSLSPALFHKTTYQGASLTMLWWEDTVHFHEATDCSVVGTSHFNLNLDWSLKPLCWQICLPCALLGGTFKKWGLGGRCSGHWEHDLKWDCEVLVCSSSLYPPPMLREAILPQTYHQRDGLPYKGLTSVGPMYRSWNLRNQELKPAFSFRQRIFLRHLS